MRSNFHPTWVAAGHDDFGVSEGALAWSAMKVSMGRLSSERLRRRLHLGPLR
jgi:hypothetical protein